MIFDCLVAIVAQKSRQMQSHLRLFFWRKKLNPGTNRSHPLIFLRVCGWFFNDAVRSRVWCLFMFVFYVEWRILWNEFEMHWVWGGHIHVESRNASPLSHGAHRIFFSWTLRFRMRVHFMVRWVRFSNWKMYLVLERIARSKHNSSRSLHSYTWK